MVVRIIHNGGRISEVAIRSIKYILLKTDEDLIFTFKKYSTLFSYIAFVTNNHLLCYSNHINEDSEVITSTHLLTDRKPIILTIDNYNINSFSLSS